MPIPDTLAQKIELFRETGRVFRKNEELFAENSWVQVMMGQGIEPQSWHPIAEKLRDDELALRSEEHTSELQSLMRISYAVFCLKKKNHNTQHNNQPFHTAGSAHKIYSDNTTTHHNHVP